MVKHKFDFINPVFKFDTGWFFFNPDPQPQEAILSWQGNFRHSSTSIFAL